MTKWTDPTKYCWGVDVSHWRPKVDYKALAAAGCAFIGAKTSESDNMEDSSFAAHVDGAYWADMPMVAFHFLDPQFYTQFPLGDKSKWPTPAKDAQLQKFVHALQHKTFHVLAVDVERWWVSYDEYYEYVLGKRKKEDVRKIPAAWICATALEFGHRVRSYFPGVPVWIYSSVGFINEFTTYMEGDKRVSLHDAINSGGFGSWTAFYPYGRGIVNVPSWDHFWSNYAPPDILHYGGEDHSGPPWLGYGWDMWQCSGDKFVLPGVSDLAGALKPVDINIVNGSKEQFYERIGFTPGQLPDPDPDPEPTPGQPWQTTFTRNVRANADLVAPIIDTQLPDVDFTITEYKAADGWIWGKREDGSWVSLAKDTYARPK